MAAEAPTEALRKHLDRLCSRTEERIAATPMEFSDSSDVLTEKIKAAMDVCLEEVGGAPGEGRADRKPSFK